MNSPEMIKSNRSVVWTPHFSSPFRPVQAVIVLACLVVPHLECRAGGLMVGSPGTELEFAL